MRIPTNRHLVLLLIVLIIFLSVFVDDADAAIHKKTKKKKTGTPKKAAGGGIKKKTAATGKALQIVFPGAAMACHKVHFMLSNGFQPQKLLRLKTSKVNNNRNNACGSVRSWPDGSSSSGKTYCNAMGLVCDEFPFHSTTAGGSRASVFCVPPSESSTQGGKWAGAVRKAKKTKADGIVIEFNGSNNFEQVKKTCVNHLKGSGASGKHLSHMTHLAWSGGDPVV
ncbi:hypothetical protein HDU97_005429 [Phlyctochytrium planicorne]|nr:hypothetical protein HDU97_005429 [Phlyctochytrium planicorne]